MMNFGCESLQMALWSRRALVGGHKSKNLDLRCVADGPFFKTQISYPTEASNSK